MKTMLAQMVEGRNIRQCELAKALGITRAAVSQQLRLRIRSIRVAARYGEILKCNPLFLLEMPENAAPRDRGQNAVRQ